MQISSKNIFISVTCGTLVSIGLYAAVFFQPTHTNANLLNEYSLQEMAHVATQPTLEYRDTNLILSADKEHNLGDYTPDDLIQLQSFPGYYLRHQAADMLEKMVESANKDSVNLTVISAYRSYSTQRTLFNTYANTYGREEANTFSALPGHSEHQLGTTVDFGNNDSSDFTNSFENTAQSQWLAENAIHYGFVLSYPEGETEITGYIYEPWHYRYIGVKNAYAFRASGLTLNQYLTQ